jgi:hypothetical protein
MFDDRGHAHPSARCQPKAEQKAQPTAGTLAARVQPLRRVFPLPRPAPPEFNAVTDSQTNSKDMNDIAPELTATRTQRLYVRYFTAILIDLVVLNLFAEHWDAVYVDNFTITLAAAVLLQVLLRTTMAIEHRVAEFWKAKPGSLATFMRYFSAWLILFGSKFAILEAVSFAFGDKIEFRGPLHGVVAIIVVLVVMVLAELFFSRIYHRLGNSGAGPAA